MTNYRYWILLGISSVLGLVFSLMVAPVVPGRDVFLFRDAGWALASQGAFVSAGLPYGTDLVPHLFAHYTPLMPLLFAGFLCIFPKNPYAGTVFNGLIGILAASLVLREILHLRNGWMRNLAAFITALLPVIYVTGDRPEGIALVLFLATVNAAFCWSYGGILAAFLIALTFLAHPFAGICAGLWSVSICLIPWLEKRVVFLVALRKSVRIGALAVLFIAAVAAFFYWLDPTSLQRFAQHALGVQSGLGVQLNPHSKQHLLSSLRGGLFNAGSFMAALRMLFLAEALVLFSWFVLQYRKIELDEKAFLATGLVCYVLSVLAFPSQNHYIHFLGMAIPAAFCIVVAEGRTVAKLAPAMLFLFFLARIPSTMISYIQQYEETNSYLAAREQPWTLKQYLPSRDATVAVSTGSFDVFRPAFSHLVDLSNISDNPQREELSALGVCYQASLSEGNSLASFPPTMDAMSYTLVQRTPTHLWITLLGHKVMKQQWGYGCDLYVRNSLFNSRSSK